MTLAWPIGGDGRASSFSDQTDSEVQQKLGPARKSVRIEVERVGNGFTSNSCSQLQEPIRNVFAKSSGCQIRIHTFDRIYDARVLFVNLGEPARAI